MPQRAKTAHNLSMRFRGLEWAQSPYLPRTMRSEMGQTQTMRSAYRTSGVQPRADSGPSLVEDCDVPPANNQSNPSEFALRLLHPLVVRLPRVTPQSRTAYFRKSCAKNR